MGYQLAKSKDAPEQQILPPDPLQSLVAQVDKLSNGTSATARLVELLSDYGNNSFLIGGVLWKIRSENWCGQFKTFNDLCAHYGIHRRRAYYSIRTYEAVVSAGLTWEDVAEVGWTKLRCLTAKLGPSELKEWLPNAKSLSLSQLEAAIKTKSITAAAPVPKTRQFKLYPEQLEVIEAALEKAKHQAGTQSDGKALELICIAFGSGATGGSLTTGAQGSGATKGEEPISSDLT